MANFTQTEDKDKDIDKGIDKGIDKDKGIEKDNNYIKTQLYDIYIVSINLLSNENYLNYIDHSNFHHLNEHYSGDTKEQKQINTF